jgi:hypothetical protein
MMPWIIMAASITAGIGPDGTPKVADFGIARAVAETTLTQTGTLIGSVHYMAPELVTGQEATPASDQYAVGVLLFLPALLRGTGIRDAPVLAVSTAIPGALSFGSRLADVVSVLEDIHVSWSSPCPEARYAVIGAGRKEVAHWVPVKRPDGVVVGIGQLVHWPDGLGGSRRWVWAIPGRNCEGLPGWRVRRVE